MNRIENMFMSFKGVRSETVGARLISMPIRQHTALRGSKVNLPGRDGFLLVPEGYQEITVKVDLAVPDNADLPAAMGWLMGSGDLVFGDFPTKAYQATVMTVTPLQSITTRLEGQKFTVTFTCQPFLHLVNEAQIILTSGYVFNGQGDVNAMPLIEVEGSGSQTLMINGRSMLLTLTAGTPLYIDNDAGTAYTVDGDALVFAGERVNVEDDWFELYPESDPVDTSGWNNISFTSGITKVTLTPRWRFA